MDAYDDYDGANDHAVCVCVKAKGEQRLNVRGEVTRGRVLHIFIKINWVYVIVSRRKLVTPHFW